MPSCCPILKQQARQGIEQILPPKQTRRPLPLLLSPSFFYVFKLFIGCLDGFLSRIGWSNDCLPLISSCGKLPHLWLVSWMFLGLWLVAYQYFRSGLVHKDEFAFHLVQKEEDPLFPLPGLWGQSCIVISVESHNLPTFFLFNKFYTVQSLTQV